jgi:ring-1,2-phenylacetyl-CoA epoxidase subunit PaaC
MEAVKELLFKMADDALVMGHRNSEWTGLGPTLEEDIAFSSMAQDKIGHAYALYQILHDEFQEPPPDELAFKRAPKDFRCCQFAEVFTRDYAFALMRHFLFDHAEAIRYDLLRDSSHASLADLAKKVHGELKYHTLHADTWAKHLAQGTDESLTRMQSALDDCFPLALGVFEPGPFESELMDMAVFVGEEVLKDSWLGTIEPILSKSGFKMPDPGKITPAFGGRQGHHTGDLEPLLKEMREVIDSDPGTEW